MVKVGDSDFQQLCYYVEEKTESQRESVACWMSQNDSVAELVIQKCISLPPNLKIIQSDAWGLSSRDG